MMSSNFLNTWFEIIFSQLQNIIPAISNLSKIAWGGSKFVYKAQVSGRWEAIKVCHLNLLQGDSIRLRAFREIDSLTKLTSPYIVKLGQIEPHVKKINDVEFLIYSEEYLPGKSLQDLMQEQYVPSEIELKNLLSCLLNAIEETASSHLVHRDIKPGNVIKNVPPRTFVLIDFSIALATDPNLSHLTATGMMSPKTNAYAAPELFAADYHQIVTYRTDLYCAAYTVFSYALGQPYFKNINELLGTKRCPLLCTLRTDISEKFSCFLAQLLKKDSNLRSGNITKLKEELKSL